MEAHNTTRELPYCEEIAEAAKDGDQPQGLEFVGILVALLSTLISTFCLMWIKRSTEVEKGLPVLPCACFGGSFGKPWRRILVIAMVGNLLSEAFLSTIAYLFAPLSRILPVAGSALIFSGLIASMGLVPGIKEKLSIAEWAVCHDGFPTRHICRRDASHCRRNAAHCRAAFARLSRALSACGRRSSSPFARWSAPACRGPTPTM
jgi:hypothetical protein